GDRAPAADDPRRRARAARPAAGLSVLAALQVRRRPLPDGTATGPAARDRACPLPLSSRRAGGGGDRMNAPVVIAEDLSIDYEVGGGLFGRPQIVHAVVGASFSIAPGK